MNEKLLAVENTSYKSLRFPMRFMLKSLKTTLTVLVLSFAFSGTSLFALDNGLARVPYMGWNTWYAGGGGAVHGTGGFLGEYNLSELKAEADALVNTGLRDLGYNILWLDAGWAQSRNTNGSIVPKFSIPELATYCHTRNLKLGLYTDTDPIAYIGVGSGGHIQADMDQLAAWGCDALKVDVRGGTGGFPTFQKVFGAFRDAITNRFLLNVVIGNQEDVWSWGPQTCHSWRTGGDINWNTGGDWHMRFDGQTGGYLSNLDKNMAHPEATRPGGYNDPDYMNGVLGPVGNRSQFSMWAMMSAPLILGIRVSQADSDLLNIYKNKEVIALDQDPLCSQCRLIAGNGNVAIYKKNLKDGNIAVAFLNRGSSGGIQSDTKTDTFNAVSASKVRLCFTSTQPDATGACPSIWEFEVYNGSSTTNLALNKPASASSEFNASYNAGKANDGNSATRWNAAAGTGNGEWLEINFGVVTTFNRVAWKQAFNRVVSYAVQYWNGSTWVDATSSKWNAISDNVDITVNWSELGISGNFLVRDLWEHADKSYFTNAYTATNVPPLGCTLTKVFTASSSTNKVFEKRGKE